MGMRLIKPTIKIDNAEDEGATGLRAGVTSRACATMTLAKD
jgi:hypothetical protein